MSRAERPATPLRETGCPLCGGDNACAPARSGCFDTPCWCTQLRIDPAKLARIPPALKDRACLCHRCAGASS